MRHCRLLLQKGRDARMESWLGFEKSHKSKEEEAKRKKAVKKLVGGFKPPKHKAQPRS